MKYYAPINYPSNLYYNLQQNAVKYLNELGKVHGLQTSINVPLDLNTALTKVPEITHLLDTLNLKPEIISMYKVARTFDTEMLGPIAGYYSKRVAIIELPIIGCDFSTTEFYQAKLKQWNKQPNGFPYITVDEETAELVDTMRLTGPMIVRHRAPHRVTFDRQFLTRISLKISTTTDPVSFL